MATEVNSLIKQMPFLAAYQATQDPSKLFEQEEFVQDFWRALCSSPSKSRLVLLKILRQNDAVLLKKLPQTYRVLFTNAILGCVSEDSPSEVKLLALKVLLGMSFNDSTSSHICLSSAVCGNIVRLCLQHAVPEMKEAAVQLLLSWSNFPQVRLAFLEDTHLINSLLLFGNSGSFSKEWILKAFVTLVSSLMHKTLEQSNLVAWLVECLNPRESSRIRVLALACLYNISLLEFNHVLIDRKGVMPILLQTACTTGEEATVALRTMASLATVRTDVQVSLFRNGALMDRLIVFARGTEGPGLQEAALSLLYRLSYAEENEIPMFQHPSLVDNLIAVVRYSRDAELRHCALETINNLCCSLPNNLALFRKPGIVDLLLNCVNSGDTAELREASTVALQNLSYCVSSRAPLFQHPDLVDSLIRLVNTASKVETRLAALGTLYALSLEQDNRDWMRRNRPLLYALLDALHDNQDAKVHDRVMLTLEKLGCTAEHVHDFKLAGVLCSARDIPRLGQKSSLRVMPKELVRKVAAMLYLPENLASS